MNQFITNRIFDPVNFNLSRMMVFWTIKKSRWWSHHLVNVKIVPHPHCCSYQPLNLIPQKPPQLIESSAVQAGVQYKICGSYSGVAENMPPCHWASQCDTASCTGRLVAAFTLCNTHTSKQSTRCTPDPISSLSDFSMLGFSQSKHFFYHNFIRLNLLPAKLYT